MQPQYQTQYDLEENKLTLITEEDALYTSAIDLETAKGLYRKLSGLHRYKPKDLYDLCLKMVANQRLEDTGYNLAFRAWMNFEWFNPDDIAEKIFDCLDYLRLEAFVRATTKRVAKALELPLKGKLENCFNNTGCLHFIVGVV